MHLTLINAYAPTATYTLRQRELFYQNLTKVLRSVPKDDKLLILGDFNARVDRDAQSWPDVIGPHAIGHENTNGQLLLTFCTEQRLTITNTLYRRQKADVKKKLDVQKLNEPKIKETLIANLANQLEHLPAEGNLEKAWANFWDAVYDSASLTLGHTKRKHQDWFDNKEITTFLQEKKEAFTAWLNDKDSQAKHESLKNIRGKMQTELRQMKDKWWENKAAELQRHADEHNSKKFFAGLKDVYGPTLNAMAPVRSADGTLLTEKSDIIQRWSEHVSQLLNRPSQIDQHAI
ncbi:uncharacterized protein LOC106873996 [Octopus bimaculoides]|uniref:uncharacterized protein LOC106873996 n=1 Tax=Octopus bimaculoides TaxID=37653 RepID=UPI00071D4AEE|nr:uncharacterized protein LOC106873996 [Octopus bimaculoides]|eukprot:XP_014777027.1 PREDICTED: uncharacterized protein LOC106873996 [Octopus bimaculoides]